jgi:hypothetical protein
LASYTGIKIKIHRLRKGCVAILLLLCLHAGAQTRLYLDSMLKVAYVQKYKFSEGLMCVPFYCDPFYDQFYKKGDTNNLCNRYVFVNKNFEVKIKPGFQLPCSFEPRFSEGLCAVSIDQKIVFIDTLGQVKLQTGLLACSGHKHKVLPFKDGKAKVYKGSGTIKNYFDVYYIDRQGKRIPDKVMVYVKEKTKPVIIPTIPPVFTEEPKPPVFDLPPVFARNKYPILDREAALFKEQHPHLDNRMLLYFNCGSYQLENMDLKDTVFCGTFVFVDTFFNVRIRGFDLPCAFEPEFSEGLSAVSIDSMIVYIDTSGHVVINTGLPSCNTEFNKASTFRNGIATLYQGDKRYKGVYTTYAINTKGERVRLLEFDELELAEKKVDMFANLSIEECANCFVGKGKTNGLWFLIEKSGKIRKKLILK